MNDWNGVFTREVQHDRYGNFEELFGEVGNSTVLDYGGNSGNLLHFSEGKIKQENYTCVDLNSEALATGQADYPDATWILSNRYSWIYNYDGVKEFPALSSNYDYTFSYSVFSHTDFTELVETLKWMREFNPKGMAHSVLLTTDTVIANWFWHRRVQEYGKCVDYRDNIKNCKNVFSVMDNNMIIESQKTYGHFPHRHIITFYNKEWLISELAKEGLEVEIIKPNYCYQSFIVWKK